MRVQLLWLALEHGIYRFLAKARGNSSGGNIGVRLERHLNYPKSMTAEDCVSLLPDIAERADESIPVQHGATLCTCSRLSIWLMLSFFIIKY